MEVACHLRRPLCVSVCPQAALELPVAVTRGSVGRLSLTVPWTSLWSSPLVVTVSDVLVLAAPVASRPYDPQLERRLARAAKRSTVSRLERDDAIPGQSALWSRGHAGGFCQRPR